MANASYIQDSFAGGEKSQLAQGRITERDYRTWMNVCLNGHPNEGGAWVRRSGTMFAGTTRGTFPGRVMKFDFSESNPYTIEFTDSYMRFRTGTTLARTNDDVLVSSISTANPAIVTLASPVNWVTGNTVVFPIITVVAGVGAVQLSNRQFLITVIDSTHLSLAVLNGNGTSTSLDGSTIGPRQPGTTIGRLHEITTPYANQVWHTIQLVQAETNSIILQGSVSPYIVQATTLPTSAPFAQFSLSQVVFLDGPYLDPFTNGVQVVPGAKSGTITFTMQFPTWVSFQAYKIGDFVTLSNVNYVSLIDNNVGSTPPSVNWAATNAQVAINGGKGFQGTDVGRLVRVFSEPDLWNSMTAYVAGNIVSYNPSGIPGAATYWTSLTSNTNKIPGNDVTNWQLTTNAALWSWGRIISFQNQISQGTGANIGSMTGGGGLGAAFDGIISQSSAQSAFSSNSVTNSGFFFAGSTHVVATIDGYVGKNYTGSPQQIQAATVWPCTDFGFAFTTCNLSGAGMQPSTETCQLNLRAKSTAPSSPSDGTLLGSLTVSPNLSNPVSITSNDQVTAWNYVWIEYIALGDWVAYLNFSANVTVTIEIAAAEVQFFTPPTSAPSSNTFAMELLGPPLLYTTPVRLWRLGAYSNTTGWPTCGTYHQGRLWLGGAIDNRFDASVSNGLSGNTLNMAPTDQNGVVGAANAITGVANSDSVNPIFWFVPDLQGVIMGTQGGEWLISAPSPGAISPTNVDANRVTKIGCANVEPRKTDHTTVFVQRYNRKAMEYFTDVYSGKFAAPNLAKDALHITKPGIVELAYVSAVAPIIWGRNADGTWWGTTYKRDTLATSQGPTINGWHRHSLGSGRSVQSICAGPSVGGTRDALTLATLDPTTGIYHVEVMTDIVDEGNTLLQATYLDDAVNPTSTGTSNTSPAPYGGLTINGLWHLNGNTVTAWLGGLDCGDYLVTNGSITVPYGDGISAGTANGLFTAAYAASLSLSQMLVGFTFTSQGQIVRPATPQESGARNGPAVGKRRRNHKVAGQFEGTGIGVSFGTTFAKLDPAKFRQDNDVAFAVNQQFTGIYRDTLTDTYSFDGMICWQVTRPYPCNIADIGGFIETSDE